MIEQSWQVYATTLLTFAGPVTFIFSVCMLSIHACVGMYYVCAIVHTYMYGTLHKIFGKLASICTCKALHVTVL